MRVNTKNKKKKKKKDLCVCMFFSLYQINASKEPFNNNCRRDPKLTKSIVDHPMAS